MAVLFRFHLLHLCAVFFLRFGLRYHFDFDVSIFLKKFLKIQNKHFLPILVQKKKKILFQKSILRVHIALVEGLKKHCLCEKGYTALWVFSTGGRYTVCRRPGCTVSLFFVGKWHCILMSQKKINSILVTQSWHFLFV